MDGRGGVTPRNWDFSHNSTGNVIPNAVLLGHHETSLKMSSYSGNREPHFPAIDLQWVPQRNFLSNYAKDPPHMTHITSPSLVDMHVAPPPQLELQEKPPPKISEGKNKKGKGVANKALRPKEPKKKEKKGNDGKSSSSSSKKNAADLNGNGVIKQKRNQDEFSQDLQIDVSAVPAPICSCTGVSRQCYRWGSGGWQSSCCTTTVSEYPLPMSQSRPGARMSGRKMSVGAFKRVLLKLSIEGHDLANPVDLKDHWARHGTNKFVTIR